MKLSQYFFVALATFASSGSLADTKSEIEAQEAALYDAFLRADADTMREIFAEDFLYQHGSGIDFDETSFSALIEDGTAVVTRAETPSLSLKDFGSTVVSSGASQVEGLIGGDPFAGTLRFVNVWHREAGKWYLHHRNSEFID